MLQVTLTSTTVIVIVLFIAAVFLRRLWQGSTVALLVGLVAASVVEVCDLLILLEPDRLVTLKPLCLLAESCLPLSWLFFCATYARSWRSRQTSPTFWLMLAVSVVPLVVAGVMSPAELLYSPDFATEKLLFLPVAGYWFYLTVMTILVVALCYLERTYVSLERPDRWRVKFEVVGTGLLLTVLVIYYSQALLYRSLDMNLVPVRTASLLLGVVLMAYSRVCRGGVVTLQVSRDLAYRSVVVVAVGLYLMVLGLFGTGMQYINWQPSRSVLVGGAVFFGLVLVVFFLSEGVRRRIQVLLHKNFYQKKYDYRSKWLEFTSRLATAKNRTELESVILAFYAETFSVRGAALFLREPHDGRFRCTAHHELELQDVVYEQQAVAEQLPDCNWVVALDEAETKENLWQPFHQRHCSFLVPLCFERGVEGFIVLGQRVYTQEQVTYEDFDLMKTLAHQAIGVLLSRKLYTDLVVAKELAAIGRVSTFVIHDLKNLMSSLGLVVDNARDYIDDEEFRADMFETLDNTLVKMNSLITRLQNAKRQPQLSLIETDLLQRAHSAAQQAVNPAIDVRGEPVKVCADEKELEKVLLNLFHNAREASASEQAIVVEVGAREQAYVRVCDSGEGMSEEFVRTRLFKPFETTKKKGMGIGLYQCRQVVENHGGRIDVQSTLGQGSVFTVWLPLAPQGCDSECVDQ